MSIEKVIGIAVLLTGAWFIDRARWRMKAREKLVAMLQSGDWRYYKAAIKELRRRGEDVSGYLPKLVSMLVSDSKVERTAAKVTLQDCFPELAAEIKDYTATATIEACRAKAAPLLSRFPASS